MTNNVFVGFYFGIKLLIYISSVLICNPCSAQVRYDYILSEDIKILSGSNDKCLAYSSLTEKEFRSTFGKPDTVLYNTEPFENKLLFYGGNTFNFDYEFESPSDIKIVNPALTLVLQDTIEVKVNGSIEKILKYYPNSAQNIQDFESGIKDLILYIMSKPELLNSEWGYSYLIISYIPETNTIHKIHQFIRD